jgi:hypothetical protein
MSIRSLQSQNYVKNKAHNKYPLSQKYYEKYLERIKEKNKIATPKIEYNGVITTNDDGKIIPNIFSEKYYK